MTAFDTGPGNMVTDALVSALTRGRQAFDRDGRWAARGQVSEKLLAEMMTHPFLQAAAPQDHRPGGVWRDVSEPDAGVGSAAGAAPGGHGSDSDCLHRCEHRHAYRRFVFPKLNPPETEHCKSSWAAAAR